MKDHLLTCAVALGLALSGCERNMGPVEWHAESLPTPAGGPPPYVTAIAGSGPRDIWVTGSAVYHSDGHAFTRVELPGPVHTLRAIAALDRDHAFGAGSYGTVARFDGTAWHAERLPGIDFDLLHVAAWPGEAWITAAGDEYFRWAGKGWERVRPPAFAGKSAHALWGTGPARVFVVLAEHRPRTPGSVAAFDGRSWTVTPLGPPGALQAIHGSAADDVWVVGQRWGTFGKGGQAHHFDGSAWVETPLPVDVPLWGVYARSKTEAYAVGDGGVILRWDGGAWHRSPSGTRQALGAVYAPPGGPVLCAGGGVLLRHRE